MPPPAAQTPPEWRPQNTPPHGGGHECDRMMRAPYGRFAAMIATNTMISYNSVPILTNSRASIRDPRVRALADDITAAQSR